MKLTTKIAAVILNSAFLILNLSSCYVWWEQKIPMDSETPQVDLSEFFYEEKEITSLEAPTQVIASQGLFKDSIKLRWDEVNNAKSYRIERAVKMPDSSGNYTVPEEGDFQLLEKYVYNTTYEDKILSSAGDSNSEYNYQYYYRICAENIGKGYESSPYTDISNPETAAKGWLLSPPKNLSADKGKHDDSIEIKWDAIPGVNAKEYVIYRGQNPKGLSMEEIATVRGNQTSYVNEIAESSEDDMVIIRWTPAIGFEEPYNKIYTYNIYSDTEQNGSFSIPLETNYTTSLSADGWYEATVRKQPFYKISTVNEFSTESEKSYAVAPVPEAPTDVTATKTKWFPELDNLTFNTNEVYPVKITWKKPATDNPYGYNIYRSTKPDSSFRKLNEKPILSSEGNGFYTYIDENETARAGTYYYYKVVSINVLGQGKKSNDPANDTANKCRGYGAITREQWFREYNKTTKHSQTKLTLMHKSGNTDKLGQETAYGDISGSLFYNAKISGLSGDVQMTYTNYADFYIADTPDFGPYFVINGNTNTKAGIDTNGNMYGTVNCTGMYPGGADYTKLVIKGGAAGGGTYEVKTFDLDGNPIFPEASISWLVGEE